uniref:Uncharacterized protein n=1 Tax=Onchocerca volvulus TaxID=6282 RepID=A0A8R1Y2R8_ONCVO
MITSYVTYDVALRREKKMSESGSLGTSSTGSDTASDPFSQLLASMARPIPCVTGLTDRITSYMNYKIFGSEKFLKINDKLGKNKNTLACITISFINFTIINQTTVSIMDKKLRKMKMPLDCLLLLLLRRRFLTCRRLARITSHE